MLPVALKEAVAGSYSSALAIEKGLAPPRDEDLAVG
jgi:hypothetical protein